MESTQENTYKAPNAVLSVLLCVFAVVFICVFIVLTVVRSLGVGHIIRHTDIVEIIEESTIGFHPEQIVDQINELPISDVDVSLEDIEEFIKLEVVTNELDNILDAYAMAFIMGNFDHQITADDIVDIARRLEPELYDVFGYRLEEEDLEFLAAALDEVIEFDTLSIYSIMEEFDADLTVPFLLISPALVWAVGIAAAVLLVIIFLRKRKSPVDASLAVGIPIALSGLMIFLTGLVIGSNPTMLGNSSLQFVRLVEYPIQLATRYGMVFTAVGVAIIVVAFIFKSVAPRTDVR
jgi:hypothetical protein